MKPCLAVGLGRGDRRGQDAEDVHTRCHMRDGHGSEDKRSE